MIYFVMARVPVTGGGAHNRAAQTENIQIIKFKFILAQKMTPHILISFLLPKPYFYKLL